MLAKVFLGCLPLLAGGWMVPGGFGNKEKALAQWTLPPRIGTLSSVDCASDGLVVGTSKGFVVKFGVDQNLKPSVSYLEEGRRLLHACSTDHFVGGCFYDERMQMYVVRTLNNGTSLDIYHETHVLGCGFMRVLTDLCFFSLSIDGLYVLTSLRRRRVVKTGKIQDLVGAKPSCMSIVEDGVVAVGSHDGQVVLVDMARYNAVPWTYTSPFAPVAIHAVRKSNAEKAMYALAWTGSCGSVCSGSILGKRRPVIMGMEYREIADEALVNIRISQQNSMAMQSVSGKTLLVRENKKTLNDMWIVPMPCMDNFVWACNEKDNVCLFYFEDKVHAVQGWNAELLAPCDTEP